MEPVGVIAVVDEQTRATLDSVDADWVISPPVRYLAEMWSGLADGTLDTSARLLIFGTESDEAGGYEGLVRAAVTMLGAGAFVAITGPNADGIVDMCHAAAHQAEVSAERLFVMPGRSAAEIAEVIEGSMSGLVNVGPSASLESGPFGAPPVPPVAEVSPTTSTPPVTGMPREASAELLSRPRKSSQTTITVTSSKGGSGKSTVSILLASAIARASRETGSPLSVCLVDLDTRDGQVASMIGQFMPTALNIRVQPVWDEERIRRGLVRAENLGIDTLLAPIRPRTAQTVGPDFYRTIVRSLQRMYDVVVIDTSVQYLEPLIADVALVEADEVLFVTNLAATAVQGMARALREITAPLDESGLGISRDKVGIVVNQSLADVGMGQEQVLAAGLGVPVVGVIPLATKDVLTATNLLRMHDLLEHPLVGPAYVDLARACLPGASLGTWPVQGVDVNDQAKTEEVESTAMPSQRRGWRR